MPIYEYSCERCGGVVERIQKFSDPPLTEHDDCGGRLTKLISQSSFHLKGSGWYVTDYAQKGSADSASDADVKTETPAKSGEDSGAKKSKSSAESGKAPTDKTAKKSGNGSKKDGAK